MTTNVKGWIDLAAIHYQPTTRGPMLCGLTAKQVPRCKRTHDHAAPTCKQCLQGLCSVNAATARSEATFNARKLQKEAEANARTEKVRAPFDAYRAQARAEKDALDRKAGAIRRAGKGVEE